MEGFREILFDYLNNTVLYATFFICGSYLILALISAVTLLNYQRKNSYVNYESLLTSPFVPSISIIAPAFNESATIIENIRTLLSLHYNNFEIIIVNDGSKDDTLKKVIEHYKLEKVNYAFEYVLPCKRIRGIYKSTNRSYTRLTVIDKANGGKADSLNAGINISHKELIVTIDVDSILVPDSLLRMVKPFLEETDKKVIATGGVVRIVNECQVRDGKIEKVVLPKAFLPRVQVLEYTRAFLIGRIAWSRLDGLMLISGAFGMFDKDIVIRAGGYNTDTVGEDMELVVRMRRYMADNKRKYKVMYIPDPLCWTEVPDSLKILGRQRNRWTRGTIETLRTHRKLFLNKRYGNIGRLGYPYWFVFEWLAPLGEFFGMIYVIIASFFGGINLNFFLLLSFFAYSYAVCLSFYAVLFEEMTFHMYQNKREVGRLLLTALIEPFTYHPLVIYWAVRGNIDYLKGKKSWGNMERTGFQKAKAN